MAKTFNLKLSLLSFNFCRSNQVSTLPETPLESTLFSPITPKSLRTLYSSNFPEPPPTSPNDCSSKITSFSIKESQPTCEMTRQMYNSPVAYDSDDTAWPIAPPKGHKQKMKTMQMKKKASRGTVMSVSSADSGWFSSEECEGSSSENYDSSCEFGDGVVAGRRKKRDGNAKVKSLRKYFSSSSLTGGGESQVRKLKVIGRMKVVECGEGKVKGSFAVVKNSEDPYEDFKRSMMEMIREKHMVEAKDLEQLLQCFLSLNHRHHHAVIVQAFSEIWQTLLQ